MRDPVIITGAPRSGIWLVAGAFEAAGGFGGLLDQAGELENIAIRDRMERPLLEGLGFESRGFGQLPHFERILALTAEMKKQWRTLIDDIFIKQDCPDKSIRFIASQVACLLWPLWHAAFPEAQWIVVRRNDERIIASCQKTGFVKSYRAPADTCRRVRSVEELNLLIDGYKMRFEQMRHANLAITEFWPQQIYDGQLESLALLLASHGLTWVPEVGEFVRPFQWKHGTLQVEGVTNDAHE